MIAIGFMFLGAAVLLAVLALACGLCHMDTPPRRPARVVKRGEIVDMVL